MSSAHDASWSAVGYLFQVKWALLELLRHAAQRPQDSLSLERLDDIAWDKEGTPLELLQLKHHQGAAGSVGDMSDDVWRTIQVWLDADDPASAPYLYFVTTQQAGRDTALEVLRLEGRDEVLAERRLLTAAETSRAQKTAATRQRFVHMDPAGRARLVSRMYVLDNSPMIEDVDALVAQALFLALPRGHEETFLGLLWAWWYQISLDLLQGRRVSVTGASLQAKISDIRDDFSRDRLPTLAPPLRDESGIENTYSDHTFVHQLAWVEAPSTILTKAIADYYRAITQTRLWLEDDLIGIDELQSFEDRLKDEWEREFAWHVQELPPTASDQEKVATGRALLRKILAQTHIRVRERYDDPFFARGKVHELADTGRVGWHPDFESRLEQLLLQAS